MKQKPGKRPVSKPVEKTPEKKGSKQQPGQFKIDALLGKYGLWIALGMVSLLILIIFRNFIFGDAYYLFKDIGSDSLNSYYPNFLYFNQYLKDVGVPLWSFAQGMGQNIQSISINDPFYFILYFVDYENVTYMIVWMEIIKILLTMVVVYHYFKLLKFGPGTIMMGTLLFSFSSFMFIGSGWYVFSTETFCLALLLLSFEMHFQHGRWYLFPVAIALIAMLQPFNLFLYGLFFILYFLARYLSSDQPKTAQFLRLTLQLTALSLLGLLISSFFFWSNLQSILESPRVGGSSGYFSKLMSYPVFKPEGNEHNVTAILRLFANDILGNGSKFKGWYNYLEAPLFYIGLLPLLLLPQFFFLANRRKAIVFGLLFAILALPVVFPFFRYSFWLFTGDYYRGFSFFISLTILLMALTAADELLSLRKINLPVLVVTFLILMVLLYYPYSGYKNVIDHQIQASVRNFLILYLVIAALTYLSAMRPYLGAVLVFFMIIEIGFFNSRSLQDRVVLTKTDVRNKFGYNDYAMDAAAFIRKGDSHFHRVNKTYTSNPAIHTSFNDAKAQGYYGTMVYGSFNQKYYIRFMEEMGVIRKGNETESRWVKGLVSRPLLQNLVSTKYTITKMGANQFRNYGYDSLTQFGDIKVLKNRIFVPLGFTYNQYIELDSFLTASDVVKDMILQKAFVAETPVDKRFLAFRRFSLKDTVNAYTFQEFYADVANQRQDTLAISSFSENHIKGSIVLDSARMLFLSIPYDKGWHIRVDQADVQPAICNIGFMGIFLEPGQHQIELNYRPPFYHQSLLLTLAGIAIYLILLATRYWLKRRGKSHVTA